MTITISGTSGITLPSGSSAVGTSDSQTLTNKTIGTGYAGSTVTSGTAVASTSGTSIDFTGIPSWVKRITVMFSGVSTSSTSNWLIQIGAGSIVSTGYSSASSVVGASTAASQSSTAGFLIRNNQAAAVMGGSVCLTLLGSNVWVASGVVGDTSVPASYTCTGSLSLGGTLDRVRITTVNGTDTFDAGSINILYE